jgi:methyl-accepting chemotaxis protein
VSDIVGEIATASEEQTRSIQQVSQAVTQMDETTQQNAALVEEAAAAAQSLDAQADKMKQTVSVFRIGDMASSGAIAKPAMRAALPKAVVAVSPKAVVAEPKRAVATADSDWDTF